MVCQAMLVMNTALASSAPSGAAPYIQADLGGNATLVLSAYLFGYVVGPFIAASLSESFGRRPLFIYGTLLYTLFSGGTLVLPSIRTDDSACIAAPTFNALIVLRFFAGVFGAVPTTNSGSTCGDLWTAEDRGVAMSYYSVATFAGPALGPVVGSFSSFAISAHPSWRYCFVILTAFSLLLFIPVLVLCPETYSPLLLTPLAADLRTSLSAPQIVSRMELEAILARRLPRGERWHASLDRLVIRPFEMLFTERIIFTTTIYMSFVYGLIYLLFEAVRAPPSTDCADAASIRSFSHRFINFPWDSRPCPSSRRSSALFSPSPSRWPFSGTTSAQSRRTTECRRRKCDCLPLSSGGSWS